MTADTDLRLTRYFGLSDGVFLGLQADHHLIAQRRKLTEGLVSIELRAVRR
jgi:plasmid maintenance system antidote protein VapI